MGKAIDLVPGMSKNMLLHAGPPVNWDEMCGPMRGAVIGAILYERWAKTQEEAENLLHQGKLNFLLVIIIRLQAQWLVFIRHRCLSLKS